MLILLSSKGDSSLVASACQALGLWTRALRGASGRVEALQVVEPSPPVSPGIIAEIDGVERVLDATSPHPLVDGQAGAWSSAPVLMAGPCSVESETAIHAAAATVASCGGRYLRGGAFKPRTSPYAFSGHGVEALGWMRAAADAHGLSVVTEALDERHAEAVAEHADLVQIGARNMANYALLAEVGRCARPVLLKRGPSATVDEWLLAGEHLLRWGAPRVVFCERGVRGFDRSTRYTLDLSAVALLKHVHDQAVVVDPSHAAGRRDLVVPLARAALAIGIDGLIVEFHPSPGDALSDGPQAISPESLAELAVACGCFPRAQERLHV